MFHKVYSVVETLFRWCEKCLHHLMANLVMKISTKLYQNRSRCVKDMRKHFGVFFISQFQLLFTCKTRILTFTIKTQVMWKTFTQDNMHQMLSELVGFCNRKHFGVLFGSQCRTDALTAHAQTLLSFEAHSIGQTPSSLEPLNVIISC